MGAVGFLTEIDPADDFHSIGTSFRRQLFC